MKSKTVTIDLKIIAMDLKYIFQDIQTISKIEENLTIIQTSQLSNIENRFFKHLSRH